MSHSILEVGAGLQGCVAACSDVLQLARLLFDVARSQPARDEVQAKRLARFRREAQQLLWHGVMPGETPSPRLSGAQWSELLQLISAALADTGAEAAVAHELLQVLDDAVGPRLGELFEARRGSVLLRPGDVFPIAVHDLKEFFWDKPSLTPLPWKKSRPRRRLKHLGVLPDLGEHYEVELNFHASAALSHLNCGGELVVAVVLPNVDLWREFDVTLLPEQGAFFGVQPRLPEEQYMRIRELLERAERQGATVALLPELSVTRELSERIGQWFLGLERNLSLLMAGSFHTREGGKSFNRSHTFATGLVTPLQHDKFNPFELKQLGGRPLERPLMEYLSEGPLRLAVHWSRGWTFTTLICKDFLDETALALLGALRVNFAFVAALSPETGSFRDDAALRLQGTGQTLTFLANFSGEGDRSTCQCALAVLPRRDHKVHEYPAAKAHSPTLLLFRARQPAPAWIPSYE